MPLFRYEALTHSGGSVKNTLEADSKAELVSRLRQMGYWPTDIIEETEEDAANDVRKWLKIGSGGVKAADVEFFTYQLATLVNAHVPLPRALEVTLGQIQNPALNRIVSQVKYDVEHGATFNDALTQHPKAFSDLYINMVKAGESGGVLGLVLERLAEFAERQRLLKNDVILSTLLSHYSVDAQHFCCSCTHDSCDTKIHGNVQRSRGRIAAANTHPHRGNRCLPNLLVGGTSHHHLRCGWVKAISPARNWQSLV